MRRALSFLIAGWIGLGGVVATRARADIAAPGPQAAPDVEAALERRQPARLDGVSFDTGKATLKASSEPALERVRALLAKHPDWQLRVEVHTDAQGADEWNKRLSQGRAESIVAWLVGKGIAAARLEAVGRGEEQPIADNLTAAGRAANRRIELHRK